MNPKAMRMMTNSGWIPGYGLGTHLQGNPNSIADTMGLNSMNFTTFVSEAQKQQPQLYDPPEYLSTDFMGGPLSTTPSSTLNNIQEITQNDYGLSFGDLSEIDTTGTLNDALSNFPTNYSNISEVPLIEAETGSKLLTTSIPEISSIATPGLSAGIAPPLMGLQIAGNITSSALSQNAQTQAFAQHTAQINSAHGATSTIAANTDYARNQTLINAQTIGSSVGSMFGPLGSLAGWGIGTMVGNQQNLDTGMAGPDFASSENLQ